MVELVGGASRWRVCYQRGPTPSSLLFVTLGLAWFCLVFFLLVFLVFLLFPECAFFSSKKIYMHFYFCSLLFVKFFVFYSSFYSSPFSFIFLVLFAFSLILLYFSLFFMVLNFFLSLFFALFLSIFSYFWFFPVVSFIYIHLFFLILL